MAKKPKKPKPIQGSCIVYSEGKGWVDPKGQWTDSLQKAAVFMSGMRAKGWARRAARYSKDPFLVQIVPVLVFDCPEQAQWYEASKVK